MANSPDWTESNSTRKNLWGILFPFLSESPKPQRVLLFWVMVVSFIVIFVPLDFKGMYVIIPDYYISVFQRLCLGGGATAVGAFLGFLFGFPKYSVQTAQNGYDKNRYRPNTSLDEISDWLTKMIVGVTFVSAERILNFLLSLGGQIGLVDGHLSGVVAASFVAYFLVVGLLTTYMLARTSLGKTLRDGDRDFEDAKEYLSDQSALAVGDVVSDSEQSNDGSDADAESSGDSDSIEHGSHEEHTQNNPSSELIENPAVEDERKADSIHPEKMPLFTSYPRLIDEYEKRKTQTADLDDAELDRIANDAARILMRRRVLINKITNVKDGDIAAVSVACNIHPRAEYVNFLIEEGRFAHHSHTKKMVVLAFYKTDERKLINESRRMSIADLIKQYSDSSDMRLLYLLDRYRSYFTKKDG